MATGEACRGDTSRRCSCVPAPRTSPGRAHLLKVSIQEGKQQPNPAVMPCSEPIAQKTSLGSTMLGETSEKELQQLLEMTTVLRRARGFTAGVTSSCAGGPSRGFAGAHGTAAIKQLSRDGRKSPSEGHRVVGTAPYIPVPTREGCCCWQPLAKATSFAGSLGRGRSCETVPGESSPRVPSCTGRAARWQGGGASGNP